MNWTKLREAGFTSEAFDKFVRDPVLSASRRNIAIDVICCDNLKPWNMCSRCTNPTTTTATFLADEYPRRNSYTWLCVDTLPLFPPWQNHLLKHFLILSWILRYENAPPSYSIGCWAWRYSQLCVLCHRYERWCFILLYSSHCGKIAQFWWFRSKQ